MGEVTRLHQVLHHPQLRQSQPAEQAMGEVVLHMVLGLRILNLTIARLETELAEELDRHADTAILRSLPGVGVVLAGRMLSEFGDDPTRFKDAASRRDYAGTAPITKASGGVDAPDPQYPAVRHLPGLVVQRGQRLPGRPGALPAATPARRRPREGAPPGGEQAGRPA